MMRALLAMSWLFLCSFSSADLCVPFRNCQDQRIDSIVSVWSESNLPNPSDTPFRLQVVWKQRATALYSFSNHFPDDCSYEYSGELVAVFSVILVYILVIRSCKNTIGLICKQLYTLVALYQVLLRNLRLTAAYLNVSCLSPNI